MNYYLGFDAGTQSVKVAVYDEDMNCIVSSSSPTTLNYPEPGWVSMDVDEYLALTIKGMKECAFPDEGKRDLMSQRLSPSWAMVSFVESAV